MVKLSDLKVGNLYYMIDSYDGFPVITEIKVVEKKRGLRLIENIRHLANDEELEEDYYFTDYNNYEECRYRNVTRSDLSEIFITSDDDRCIEILEELVENYKVEDWLFDMENHTPPEDYPDWDGDESIMYYIDNYQEDEDEDED